MQAVKNKLASFGITANKYRNEVLFYLETFKNHPTAREILQYLRQKYPYVSRATVYNTLKLFHEKGIVLALNPEGKKIHYDATISEHCHFVCETCGKVTDLREITLPSIQPSDMKKKLFINSVVVYLFGYCANCQAGINTIKSGPTQSASI